ncbi:hypothetical protein NK718_13355 [Alsobacter sp. SYSU M60028]|uniref:YscD cytoplasmic domain-containing protein n=1 Tax=Alsobacter ponti TaxID=2962936 RepID=A0ABT1LDC8_9HYPH|nr:FHA domain-containing protein [Alsobacter ponti]MCP8939507.1 hypothetical protein [Alsobacter ponti]
MSGVEAGGGGAEPARLVFKILSGPQIGAELRLDPGTYLLGSGPEDDLHISDVSVAAGHARIRWSDGRIEVMAGAGSLHSARGVEVRPGEGEWRELEALDVVVVGTTRFALGPVTANWTSLGETAGLDGRPSARAASAGAKGPRWRWPVVAAAAFAIGAAASAVLLRDALGPAALQARDASRDLAIVREALDAYDFGRAIATRQEADGAVIAAGYVELPAERRALVDAVGRTGVPARLRVWVRETIRADLAALIQAERQPLSFTLSRNGEAALSGVLLDASALERFVALARDTVPGLSSVRSEGVHTARSLLPKVEDLARQSRIGRTVLFRLDGTALIEATGFVTTEQVDGWTGFLQAYATRFAPLIPLRSYVSAQPAPGEPAGSGSRAVGERALDAERLIKGGYRADDILPPAGSGQPAIVLGRLPGSPSPPPADPAPATAQPAQPAARTVRQIWPAAASPPTPAQDGAPAAGGGTVRPIAPAATSPAAPAQGNSPAAASSLTAGSSPGSFEGLAEAALRQQLADPVANPQMARRLRSVAAPLLARAREDAPREPCWPGARITADEAARIALHLDLLSVSRVLSTGQFTATDQGLLAEAALSPVRLGRCLASPASRDAAPDSERSVYVAEALSTAAIAEHVLRDFARTRFPVTGVGLAGAPFLFGPDGQRWRLGNRVSADLRIAAIGELGVLLQGDGGWQVMLYDASLEWKLEL